MPKFGYVTLDQSSGQNVVTCTLCGNVWVALTMPGGRLPRGWRQCDHCHGEGVDE